MLDKIPLANKLSVTKQMWLFYIIILITWAVFGIFKYINPDLSQDSYVVAQYLDNSTLVALQDVAINNSKLQFLDLVVKLNLFLFDWVFFFIFLFLVVFSKLPQKHFSLLFLFIMGGYFVPKVGTIYDIYHSGGITNLSYLTFNDLVMWLAFTPLNWAVFLYGYYILEIHILSKILYKN